MLYSIEDLKLGQKIYVSSQPRRYYLDDTIAYAVYQITKMEQKGVGKWFIEMKTHARNKRFKKTIKVVNRHSLDLSAMGFEANDSLASIHKSTCEILKNHPKDNPKLFKKMMDLYPQNFV